MQVISVMELFKNIAKISWINKYGGFLIDHLILGQHYIIGKHLGRVNIHQVPLVRLITLA